MAFFNEKCRYSRVSNRKKLRKAKKLSMENAIELYTLGSAYAEFMEDRKGMIREGYLADVVIFNNDLMTIPHDQIMSAKVDYTIVGGKVVYQRKEAN